MADHLGAAIGDLLDAIEDLDALADAQCDDRLRLAVARVYHAGRRVDRCGSRLPDLGEPHLHIERIRQPLTAILGHLDLALQAAEQCQEPDCLVDVRLAHAAALRLREMCAWAERAARVIKGGEK